MKYQNGEYNTGYQLTVEEIKAAAILRSNNSDVYIGSIENKTGANLIDESFFPDIATAKNAAADGKPAFLPFTDGKHHVLVALIPDKSKPQGISVVYVNSLTDTTNTLSNTGRDFANALAVSLSTDVQDKSADQQHDECCGLSVAANIATITEQHKNNKPITISPIEVSKKEGVYKKLGREAFDYDKRIKDAIVAGDLGGFKKVCKDAEKAGFDLNSAANPNSQAHTTKAYLQLALFEGKKEIFEYMIQTKPSGLGLDLASNLGQLTKEFNQSDRSKKSLNDVKEILDSCYAALKDDVNKLNESKLLFYAVYYGYTDLFNKMITTTGIDINLRAQRDTSPCDYAASLPEQEYVEIFNALYKRNDLTCTDLTHGWGTSIFGNEPSVSDIEFVQERILETFIALPNAYLKTSDNGDSIIAMAARTLIISAFTVQGNTEEAILITLYCISSALGDTLGCGKINEASAPAIGIKTYADKFPETPVKNDAFITHLKANPQFIRTIHKYAQIVSDPIELDRLAFIINQKYRCDEYKEWEKVAKDFGHIFPFNIITERAKVECRIPKNNKDYYAQLMQGKQKDDFLEFAQKLANKKDVPTVQEFNVLVKKHGFVPPLNVIDDKRKEVLITQEIVKANIYQGTEVDKIAALVKEIKRTEPNEANYGDAVKKAIPSLITNAIKAGDIVEANRLWKFIWNDLKLIKEALDSVQPPELLKTFITKDVLKEIINGEDTKIIQYLLEKINYDVVVLSGLNVPENLKKTVEPSEKIRKAIEAGNLEEVKRLCEAAKAAGIDLNNFTRDTEGKGFTFMAPNDYYLTHASLNGQYDIFKYLTDEAGIKLENSCLGQLVMNKDFQGREKFKTQRDGALKILEYLRTKIITKKDIDDSKLLEFAVFFGDKDSVECCLKNGGDPNIQCSRGTTPIFNAYSVVYNEDHAIYQLMMGRVDLKYKEGMFGLIMQPLILESFDNYKKAEKYFTDLVLKFPKDITQADIFNAVSNLAGLANTTGHKKENLKLFLLAMAASSNIKEAFLEGLIPQILDAKYHLPQLQTEEGIKKILGANAEAIRNVADDKREELLNNIITYTEIVADPVKLQKFAHDLIHDYDSVESQAYRALVFSAGKFFPLDIIEEEKRKVRADYMLELNIKIALLKGGYVAEGDDAKLTEYTNNMKVTLQALPQYQNITAAPLIYKAVEDLMSKHLSKGVVELIETVKKDKKPDDAKALIQVASTQKMTLSDDDRFKNNQTQIEANVFEFLRGVHTEYTTKELEDKLKIAAEYKDIYELLGKLKDAKDQIYWHEFTNIDGTKHLIRDARARDNNSQVDNNSIYGRAMILMNTCRAAEDLINKSSVLNKDELVADITKIRVKILNQAINGEEFDYKKYNGEIINLLLQKGVGGDKAEDIQEKLRVTNEFIHLRDDTQHHVTTISSAKKGTKDINVIETDTMVVGLTAKQRKMYQELQSQGDKLKNNADYQWFFAMKDYEQKLTLECIPAILEAKGVIPTQLRKHLPGFRNAHCRSVSIYEKGGEVTKILEAFRTGTLSYLGKDEANAVSITEENIKQFMHLTGRMPVVNDMLSSADKKEGERPQQLMDDAASRINKVSRVSTAFNLLRLISRKHYVGHYVILNALADKLTAYKDIQSFLKTGVGEKEAREQLKSITTPQGFAEELENAVNARANMEKYFILHGLLRVIMDTRHAIFSKINMMSQMLFGIAVLPKVKANMETNLSAQIAADMVNVLFSLTKENGELRNLVGGADADKMALIIMCMSGKDRTQMVLAEASRRALEMQGVTDPAKVVAINSGHAQHMAQDNGGTRGCFGIQANSAEQGTKEFQQLQSELGQKTAKFNKMKYDEKEIEPTEKQKLEQKEGYLKRFVNKLNIGKGGRTP